MAGTTSKFNTVEMAIPPTTAVPSDSRLAEPAPLAKTSGRRPAMNAIDVMRIGRNRVFAADTTASLADLPVARCCFANSTIRMAFFAASPMSITYPICAYTSLVM